MRALLLIGLTALTACTVSTNGGVDVDPVTDLMGEWEGQLSPENNSGIVGANGQASASANLDVALSEDGQYYINVHRSPQDLGTIVACGQLRD